MSLTMRQIAAELGVSITTVSKVLNNATDIGEPTRARVLAKVAALGYHRNAIARSLTLRRSHTIGIIVADLMHSFFVEIVAAIESHISRRGYGLLLCNVAEEPQKERAQLQMLLQRQVDGVILASVDPRGDTELLRRLTALKKGVVLIDRDDHPRFQCHRVLTDDEEVGRLATSHLLALGHRAVAHLTGPRMVHARRRERGYRDAMREYGATVRPEWVVPAGFLEQDGYDAMRRLLRASPEVTAVFAANDPSAIGAMKAAWGAGRRVPEDVALVGAGDIAHGDMLKVPLTTVSWSRRELGTKAAELILERIEGDGTSPFQRVIVPPKLVVRSSCGGGVQSAAKRRSSRSTAARRKTR